MRGIIGVAAGLALSGCLALEQDPTLERFSDCDGVRAYMGDMALTEARWENDFDWSLGLGSDYTVAMESAPNALDDDGGGGAADYSTTNLQEADVDEADLVKTDGEYLYGVVSGDVVVTRAWPIDDAEVLATVPVDGRPFGIYLYGDAVVAVSSVDAPAPRSGQADGPSQAVGVTVIDVSDPAAPEVIRESYVGGLLQDTRRIDDLLYVVAYSDIRVWDYNTGLDEVRARIRDAEIEAWLPRHADHLRTGPSTWESTSAQACACGDVWASNRQTGTLVTAVMALDLSDPLSEFSGQAVVGRADVVYSSRDTLYVAWSEAAEGPFRSFDDALDTIVHGFDLSEGSPAYLDTIQVWGVLTDQFALSERAGVLRLATTDQRDWTTHVFTYGRGEGLERLDHLGGLAPGEELYAVRFVGDLGYLVTYEVARGGETVWDIEFGDPLFTLDLSDPHHIRALGELVMNGWSDYIHPLADRHLLTVGMDQDQAEDWKLAISLFDVTDLEDPILEDRELLDAFSSEAQQEHHAFNYYAPREVLALPSDTLAGEWVLQVVHVDLDELHSIGAMPQGHLSPECSRVRRSVILEDRVWAFAEGGMTAATLDAPGEILNTLTFDEADCWQWQW